MDKKSSDAEQRGIELLRKTRKERGLTQLDPADMMAERGFAWSQPTVARIEKGQRPLSLAEARALMDVLGVDRGNFYQRIASVPPPRE